MRTKLANWTRLAVVVVVVAGTQAGCKSGWKMPGSDMFSWSRKPSESTLAGSSPSLSMPSSPAQKNTPSPLVSSAANGGRSTSPYTPTSTSNPGFGMPSGTNNSMAMGGSGSAASANGYSNGPYGMVSNGARPGAPTSTGYGATPPSGFGGAQTGYVAGGPSGYGAGAPATNNFAQNSPPSLPTAYGGLPGGNGPTSFPGATNNSVQAMPAGYNPSMANAAPTSTSSMPNALPSAYQPSSMPAVANQAYNGAAPYRPGSVGRSTAYDFSTQGPGASTASFPPAPTGLPVPNTANNTNGLPPANTMYR